MVPNSTIITSGSSIADEVQAYIADHFLADFGPDLNHDTDLFVAGVIDSFGFAELVVFLEKRFKVHFEGEELTADHLNTVSNMVNTIRKNSMSVSAAKICTACVLPASFPGIEFNSEGMCNFCQDAPPVATVGELFRALREKMAAAIEARTSSGRDGYDCIVAYSGGKDSTYVLKLMMEIYRLNCLAVTIDNGFMSAQAKKNCDTVTSALGVDHIVFKPSSDFMNQMYVQSVRSPEVHARAAIKRASNMCNSCINLINIHMIKLALQNDAPIVAGGYIGGQVPKDAAMMDIDLSVLSKSRQTMQSRYTAFFGETAMKYMRLPEDLLERSRLKNVLIVNPMLTVEVTEEQIIDDISALGWKRTLDTGKNSSNCKLNDLGIAVHHRQYGFNPYVFEISEQVRNGLLDRETALEKAYSIPEFSEVAWQAKQIGLNLDEI